MKQSKCSLCKSEFLTTIQDSNFCCPFCGRSSAKIESSDLRGSSRTPIQKECILSNGFGVITGQTVDISKTGVGVMINNLLPFEKGAELFAHINPGKFYRSRVMWTKNSDTTSRAGIRFQ